MDSLYTKVENRRAEREKKRREPKESKATRVEEHREKRMVQRTGQTKSILVAVVVEVFVERSTIPDVVFRVSRSNVHRLRTQPKGSEDRIDAFSVIERSEECRASEGRNERKKGRIGIVRRGRKLEWAMPKKKQGHQLSRADRHVMWTWKNVELNANY
ncbi:hypothetical protein FRC18_011223 [Serendipita sp. 400]|nr:hypothetical protein FRC18_011223 [Serendipita sp. 400]